MSENDGKRWKRVSGPHLAKLLIFSGQKGENRVGSDHKREKIGWGRTMIFLCNMLKNKKLANIESDKTALSHRFRVPKR